MFEGELFGEGVEVESFYLGRKLVFGTAWSSFSADIWQHHKSVMMVFAVCLLALSFASLWPF